MPYVRNRVSFLKQAAQHPDSKDAKTDDKSRKRTAPPVGAGKVMKKAAGRGR